MKVAYLSPAMPALSETFVYEELLAVERRGVAVVPVSVRKPAVVVPAQQALAQRVVHLYGGAALWVALRGLLALPTFGKRAGTALGQLLSDMRQVGPVRVASWKLVYQFLAATKLARILKTQQCTHLHVHFAHTPTQIGMYASAMAGVPFTIMAHANDIFEAGLLLQAKAQRASRMLTISEFNVRHLVALGVPAGRLAVVRCGVSFAKPTQTPRAGVGGAQDGPFKIGSLGRMVEKKGFDVLLQAVAMVHQAGQPIVLHIAGDGPLLPQLRALAQTLGIGDQAHFDGAMDHNKVAGWMQGLDAFVLACKADANGDMDGIPVVLMEAMSQGVPVVSTRLSGIPELVLHQKTGLLAQPNDAASLAEAIATLAAHPALRAEMAAQAQTYVTQEFGQAVNIDRLLTHFH
jgi:colanic acid/amylovoran biosynthesis glycosyltransferase